MKKDINKALEALKRQEKQYKRQNEHIAQHYDRVSVTLPKGHKNIITANGESVNGYINRLVHDDLLSRGLIKDKTENTPETLEK